MKKIYVAAWAAASLCLGVVSPVSAQVTRWGSDTSPAFESLPVIVPGSEGASMIGSTNSDSYYIKEGKLYAFGDGEEGQLGDGSTESSATPVEVLLPAGEVPTYIGRSNPNNSALVVTAAGNVFAWGDGISGSTCLGGKARRTLIPTQVAGVSGAVAEEGAAKRTLILLANGTVLGCGSNANGELGRPGGGSSKTPVLIPGLTNIVEISTAAQTSGARNAAGEVWLFGDDEHGQVCNGVEEEEVSTPTKVILPGLVSEFDLGQDIVKDGQSFFLIGGELVDCGDNAEGQLADGTTINKSVPTLTGLHFSYVATGGEDGFGIHEGEVEAFGGNAGGDLGVTGKSNRSPFLNGAFGTSVVATSKNALSIG
jgi:alpha-tubulin suppressor-like RCC1 family protein